MNVVGTDTVGSACCWKELAWPFVLPAAPDLALLPELVRKLATRLLTDCGKRSQNVETNFCQDKSLSATAEGP